jgi:hypothetical protein
MRVLISKLKAEEEANKIKLIGPEPNWMNLGGILDWEWIKEHCGGCTE